TEYLVIKSINFNTIIFFPSYYTLLYKCITDAKFKINENFELTFFQKIIKTIYPINTEYWAASLEINKLNIGSFLIKFSNISNIKSYTNINVHIQ
ncbi:hypothetical protein QR685DRAFT_452056, partial [Neurospora intermedia]